MAQRPHCCQLWKAKLTLLLLLKLTRKQGQGRCCAAQDTPGAFDLKADGSLGVQSCQPGSARRVLVGHSMGGACAAAEVIEHPEVWLQNMRTQAARVHGLVWTATSTEGRTGRK